MNYESIREARLRFPYRPFFLKTKDGRVFFVREPEHLAVAPHIVVVYDQLQDIHEMLRPEDVDGLIDANQPLGATTDGR